MKPGKGENSMKNDRAQQLLDRINEYLFTMSEDELLDILRLIEDYIASEEST